MQTVNLSSLSPGDTFEIPALEGIIKNGVVIAVTSCSVLAEFDRTYEKNREWKHYREYLSGGTQVIRTGDWPLKKNDNGTFAPDGKYRNPNIKPGEDEDETGRKLRKDAEGNPQKRKEGKRGRKAKNLNIQIPDKKEFTIRDIAELNNIKTYEVSNWLSKIGNQVIKRNGSVIEGRGKPAYVYVLK